MLAPQPAQVPAAAWAVLAALQHQRCVVIVIVSVDNVPVAEVGVTVGMVFEEEENGSMHGAYGA